MTMIKPSEPGDQSNPIIPTPEKSEVVKNEPSTPSQGEGISKSLVKEALFKETKPVNVELSKLAQKINQDEAPILDASEIRFFACLDDEKLIEYQNQATPTEKFTKKNLARAVFNTLYTLETEKKDDQIMELKSEFKTLIHKSLHGKSEVKIVEMIQQRQKIQDIVKECLAEQSLDSLREVAEDFDTELLVPGSQHFCDSEGNCAAMSSDFIANYIDKIKHIKPEELEPEHIVSKIKEIGDHYLTSSDKFIKAQNLYSSDWEANFDLFLAREHLLAGTDYKLRINPKELAEDIANLKDGPHLFSFSFSEGKHKIALIKKREIIFLYDPNYGSFKIKNLDRFVNILNKLYDDVTGCRCYSVNPLSQATKEQLIPLYVKIYYLVDFEIETKAPDLPDELQNDRTFWLRMISRNYSAIKFLPEQLKQDRSFWKELVARGKSFRDLVPKEIVDFDQF